jgi:hypothetical protein
MRRFFLICATFGCVSGAACSTSSTPTTAVADAGNADCAAFESDADLTTPAVSFATDVLPIFQNNCGASLSCHVKDGAEAPVLSVLRSPDGGIGELDAAGVVQSLVGIPSLEDPGMDLVTANDPANSFMMHKLDGDECTLVAGCARTLTTYSNCGIPMPFAEDSLEAGTRDTVRRWIAQGANSN